MRHRAASVICVLTMPPPSPPSSLRCSTGTKFPAHADAGAKSRVFAERLQWIQARNARNPTFAQPLPGSGRGPLVDITPIDQLPLRLAAAASNTFTVCGLLTQPDIGVFAVDDGTMAVVLDLTSAARGEGFFTEGGVVLVSGSYEPDATTIGGLAPSSYEDGEEEGDVIVVDEGGVSVAPAARAGGGPATGGAGAGPSAAPSAAGGLSLIPKGEGLLPGLLRVREVAQPPPEERSATLAAMSCVDPFLAMETPAEFRRIAGLEAGPEAKRAMIAILSEVHLDEPETLAALKNMLGTYEASGSIPSMFVLMGHFSSRPFGQQPGDLRQFAHYFDALADVLAAHKTLAAETTFVLVPGPADPGLGGVLPGVPGCLPRHPIPRAVAGRLLDRSVVPKLILASNPCRIRFFTKEIVLFRSEMTTRLKRRAVLVPSPRDKPSHEHMTATLVAQGTLCPLPLTVQPVYWEHDHALRLQPPPQALIVAEDREPYEHVAEVRASDGGQGEGVLAMNPGSFAADGTFLVYRPGRNVVELSSVR